MGDQLRNMRSPILSQAGGTPQHYALPALASDRIQGVVNNNGDAESDDNGRQRYHYVKVAKLDLFYRDRHKYDNWIIQLDTYFMFNKIEDNKKTAFAFTFIRGKAHYWLKLHFKE